MSNIFVGKVYPGTTENNINVFRYGKVWGTDTSLSEVDQDQVVSELFWTSYMQCSGSGFALICRSRLPTPTRIGNTDPDPEAMKSEKIQN